MPLTAIIANTLWTASNLPAYRRFRRALRSPGEAQCRKLRDLIGRNSGTAFGKAHGFASISNYKDFCRAVPLSDYAALAPWIERIRNGEGNVLTDERITHLVPTGGSRSARKLIPFNTALQREFNAAIGPWLVDLARECPGSLGGRAYWSITPVFGGGLNIRSEHAKDALPIGFETDTAYLGGARQKLAASIMAVPPEVGRARLIEDFRYQTLLHLLCCRDLRLISVWHPTFLTLLLDALAALWERLLAEITESNPRRGRELRKADPMRPDSFWPKLQIVSCWGDAAASLAIANLQRHFPGVLVQPKGLIATEAFVTLPFESKYPLAIESHFFEFIDDGGCVFPAEALRDGTEYEVVVTTGGGLWRYQLGDRVRVTGFVENTPSLKFLGRNEDTSDRFGEKLSEPFVAEVLRGVFGAANPGFALMAPDEDEAGCRYTLYVEGTARFRWAEQIDCALRRNPHYAYCRDLGQLLPARIFQIERGAFEAFTRRRAANGSRLGDVKPSVLCKDAGWSNVFSGNYLSFEEGTLNF